MLKYERDQRLRLEEVVEQLAKQHDSLEKQARRKQLAAVSHNNSKSEGINLNNTSESSRGFFLWHAKGLFSIVDI